MIKLLIGMSVFAVVTLQALAYAQTPAQAEQVLLPPLPGVSNAQAANPAAHPNVPVVFPGAADNPPPQPPAHHAGLGVQGLHPTVPNVAHAIANADINTGANNAANANAKPATPAEAYKDPIVEEQYFQESTYGTVKDPAFENMLKKMYPMSPQQIEALRQAHETTQRAIAAPAQPVPEPTLTSQSVNLSPGSVPPVIRLSTGYVSSVVFVDETGAPWPVSAYSIGAPNSFNIQWDQHSNLLLIQGHAPYATGNIAVTLQDMPTPVMLTIVSDQGIVDYRIDLRVQGRGPNARGAIIAGALPQNSNVVLMNLLEGIAPQESELLKVTGGSAQAWLWNNQLYVRTPLTLLSPGWVATLSSADGTHVYQLPVTPMILASHHGQSITLKVEGL